MLFGRFRILGKLVFLVLVPLLGVVALSVPLVLERVDAARNAQQTADVVQLGNEVGTALQELQEERLLSIGYLFGLTQQPELVVQTAKARDRIARLFNLGTPLTPELRSALTLAKSLDRTRAGVLARAARPDFVIQDFTNVITPIIDNLALGREADLSRPEGRQIFALEAAMRSDDLISQAAGLLTAAVATNEPGFVGLFSAKLIELQQVVVTAGQYFTPEQYGLYQIASSAFTKRVGADFFTTAAADPAAAVKSLSIGTLYPSLRSGIVLGAFLEKRIASDVNALTAKTRQDAIREAYLIAGLSLLLLIVVFGLSMLMARAVARPLRRLTASADRIARAAETELQRVADDDAEFIRPVRLDPVDVAARDEIGDLARAFERVQATAAGLVERQVAGRRNVAQMFGHVGRRTQNLVGRQLALIDQLERRETDADRLRELYRLDHMSSRLRRNASSLVVLSGGAGANDHMAPLPLSDVVRLALGEIEDYTRVDVEVPEELTVLPAVVADLTLLLAELMENATSFSPPHTRVTVTATAVGDGARLAVIDHGLGLPPERFAEENARLTRRERLDLAPSEVLGLFVVGRLARRHGLLVNLSETQDGGVTATVQLKPTHLLAHPGALSTVGPVPIRASVPTGPTEFTPLITATAGRSAPGSAKPFDANVLGRATSTLKAGRSWNAFAPASAIAGTPALAVEMPVTAGRYATLDAPILMETADPAGPPSVGQQPLARRTPGASLPETTPKNPNPPATSKPMDPDEARDLIEQFEYGVALALRESGQQQHEGQPQ